MRSSLLLVVALASLVLAGCSGPSPDAQTPSSSTSKSTSSTAPAHLVPKLPITTDTLHFAGADLSPAAPKGQEDDVTPIPTPFQASAVTQGSAAATWVLTLPHDLPSLKANLTLWVDVEGTVFGDPFPSAGGCFWNVGIEAHRANPNTNTTLPTAFTQACAKEPLQVPTGIRAITIDLPLAQVAFSQGTVLDLTLDANSIPSPSSTVALLSGTPQHDSQITIQGLGAPLDAAALIQAT